MDLYKVIQDLYAEKEKLERVIASLEELQKTAGALPPDAEGRQRAGPEVHELGRAQRGFGADEEVLGKPPARQGREGSLFELKAASWLSCLGRLGPHFCAAAETMCPAAATAA